MPELDDEVQEIGEQDEADNVYEGQQPMAMREHYANTYFNG